jgi:type VI secretion system secreted protein VgrG
MAGVPYTLHFANGQQKAGTLDGNGMAEERNLPDTIDKLVYHNSPSAKDQPRPTVSELLSKLDQFMSDAPNMVNAPQDKGGN